MYTYAYVFLLNLKEKKDTINIYMPIGLMYILFIVSVDVGYTKY